MECDAAPLTRMAVRQREGAVPRRARTRLAGAGQGVVLTPAHVHASIQQTFDDREAACRACKGQCEHVVRVHVRARSEHQIEYGKGPLMTSVFER